MVVATTLSDQDVNANITRVMQILAARDQLSQGEVGLRLGHASVVTTQRYVRWTPDGTDVVADLYGDDGDAA